MTRDEAVERLCEICDFVAGTEYGYREAADCFCGKKESNPAHFRFSEKVLRFIEVAVEEKLGAEMNPKPLPVVRAPASGEVWRALSKLGEFGGGKFVVRESKLDEIRENPALFEYVCARPHDDGDFDYLCGRQYCRCSE